MRRVVITSVIIGIFLILGTILAAMYAKGYRIVPTENGTTTVEGTGLLVATSFPEAAKVYINDRFITATDDTVTLQPGEYDVKVTKEGYFPWQKKITIKKEVVSRADAVLFPIAPKLESLTTTGANNPVIDYSGTLIAYTVSSSSIDKNGIYILDMKATPILNIVGSTTQISNNVNYDFTSAVIEFSPEGDELIASASGSLGYNTYLLSPKSFNTNPRNITYALEQTRLKWENQKEEKITSLINDQRKPLAAFIRDNFRNVSFSPEQDKILYEASTSATMPIIINPRLNGTNPTEEVREIKEGNIYVYDIKEDKNYLIFDKSKLKPGEETPKFTWYPDSRHLVHVKDKKIYIMEYDTKNAIPVYAGPFIENFVYPFDGTSLVILTNLGNEDAPYNLYRLVLK